MNEDDMQHKMRSKIKKSAKKIENAYSASVIWDFLIENKLSEDKLPSLDIWEELLYCIRTFCEPLAHDSKVHYKNLEHIYNQLQKIAGQFDNLKDSIGSTIEDPFELNE